MFTFYLIILKFALTMNGKKHFTTKKTSELFLIFSSVSTEADRAWIGLEIGDVSIWRWSLSDQKTDFLNWAPGQPQTADEKACAAMDISGNWVETDCETEHSFFCHNSIDASSLVHITEPKSWRDAQSHCRNLASDLVSIHSEVENTVVQNLSTSGNLWIGLFRDPWKWSDGSNSSFRFWKPNQPQYSKNQDCVAAIFKDEGKWNDRNCNQKFSFICQGAQKSIPATTRSPTTPKSNTTVHLPTNLPTLSQESTQEVTVTFNFTKGATEQPNSTNVPTPEPTTANGSATTSTTEFVPHPSSTELNNATAEMSTQLLPITTVNVVTDRVSTSATQMGTSAQNHTQSLTPMTTTSSHSLHPENLILIQENMTWIEAMSYCRQHYIDLVHITTKEIQETVNEKVKKASSTHVWLGLRYTCTFNFWFWSGQASRCYHNNWMAGQGPEGVHECGTGGAIEATGRQQWVGLPETEELNFICSACGG
ncbi:uncharacterized protein LOC133440967 isoform X2 [Cololabis saira]|uniref:uncharacterized protein LOC133440967 isoform X2 n=1 Tax=Cololabis saira TaxID=129043 RepID=UPI002AD313CC|nr:uncharacterized protein LOC133440967 isoform X2 [Cololabis saira]